MKLPIEWYFTLFLVKITIYGKIQTTVLLSVLFFFEYETFIERSCEQLKFAKRQQMNVEISAQI